MTVIGSGRRGTRRAATWLLDELQSITHEKNLDWSSPTSSRARTILKRLGVLRGWLHYYDRSKDEFARMRDLHKGQRCFIMGNGPSLAKMDLSLLKDEVTFGVNSIFLHFDSMGFIPTYYVAMDDLVLEDRHQEVDSLRGLGMSRFLPIELAYCLEDAPDVIWMNCPDTDGDVAVPSFSKNPELFLFHGSTVTFICLQIAYHLGCDPVYLIGCDNSYIRPKSVLELSNGHWVSQEDDPNHFSPAYFGRGYRWHDPRTDLMGRSYKIAKWVFEEANRKLYNATIGGNLDVLDRVSFDMLFADRS